MTMVHFHLKHHTVKGRQGGGGGAVRYLERRDEYAPDAARYAAYHERTQGKWKDLDDLRWREPVNLPAWAKDNPEQFFETAYQHERANGRWATSIQANLPRDLTREQQIALTRAWMATHLPDRPALWVIHEPISKTDGLPQPHVHILFSERLRDGIERGPAQMFKRYNAQHPERGGARKETFGRGDRQAPYRLREAWCASANVVLEMAGASERMDPRSFQVRGITRQQVRREAQGLDDFETAVADERTPETRAHEQVLAAQWWDDYKRTMHLDLGRTSLHGALRVIASEVREPGTRTRELSRMAREPGLDQPLIGNLRSKIYHMPGDPNYGDIQPRHQMLFWSRGAAEAAGYRAAVNQSSGLESIGRLEDYQHRLARERELEEHYAQRGLERPLAGQRSSERLLAEARTHGLTPDLVAEQLVAALPSLPTPSRSPGGMGRGVRARIFDREDEEDRDHERRREHGGYTW